MLKRRSCLLEGPGKIRDVVEGLAREGLGNVAGIPGVLANHHDPGVVVVHWEPPVILGPSHLAGIFPWQHKIPWDIPRPRERARPAKARSTPAAPPPADE